MAVLYKYMSYLDNFLLDPSIKLSPPNFLNDPFESHNIEDMKRFIYGTYISGEQKPVIINGVEVSTARAKRIIENNPINLVHRSGVISLSESNRSLLMWAHYANQHKGIVIGLEDDFLSESIVNHKEDSKLIYSPNPMKVSYDTTRFDLTDFDAFPKSIVEISKVLAVKLLTTKSDDWIYEKEHRCIVPIGVSDKIIYTGKISDRTRRTRDYISKKYIKIDRKTKQVTVSPDINYTDPMYKHLSSDEKFLFLKRISPKKIKSIYFGERVDEGRIKKYFNDIEANPSTLGHIKLFKYNLCNKEFRLIKEEIDKDFFTL